MAALGCSWGKQHPQGSTVFDRSTCQSRPRKTHCLSLVSSSHQQYWRSACVLDLVQSCKKSQASSGSQCHQICLYYSAKDRLVEQAVPPRTWRKPSPSGSLGVSVSEASTLVADCRNLDTLGRQRSTAARCWAVAGPSWF